MRALFTTIAVLVMLFAVGCKKDAPTCKAIQSCCSLLKSAGKESDVQSSYCSSIDGEEETACQILLPRFLQKIKDAKTRAMCSKAMDAVIFAKEK